jgi:hypothetical protein
MYLMVDAHTIDTIVNVFLGVTALTGFFVGAITVDIRDRRKRAEMNYALGISSGKKKGFPYEPAEYIKLLPKTTYTRNEELK